MDFQSFYQTFIPVFQERYKQCISALSPASLYDPIHYTLDHPGKRLRPAFLAATSVSGEKTDLNFIMPAACCIEMVHNFTLVHDDIMDDDLLRHGIETVHAKWGKNEAILSGDGLFALALKQLDYYADYPEIYVRLMPAVLEAVIIVCEGQAMDMEFESREDVTLNDYLDMVEKKTAWLLSVATQMGAILGGAGKEEEHLIEKITRELGVVFQIQDDLLELTSDSGNMGKTLGSDLVKQKKTYPYLYAKQALDVTAWDDFLSKTTEAYVQANGVTPARQILNDNFIFDRIREVITLRHVTIRNLISDLSLEKQDMFNGMVEFVMNRKK